MNRTESFKDSIRAAGLIPPEQIIADGRIKRFSSSGKRGDEAGWYVCFNDGIPAGCFGDWRTGESTTWRADIGRILTPNEEQQHKNRIEQIRLEREIEQKKIKKTAKEKALSIWTNSESCIDHPYLTNKNIKSHGVRITKGCLVIPLLEKGELHSLQFINQDGNKKFLSGGRIKGCYHQIGDFTNPEKICIAEGLATAATIHEATNYPVIIAFNAGNLLPVARTIHAEYPSIDLYICGDTDRSGVGQKKAEECADAVDGVAIFPPFTEEELSIDTTPSDWNDYQNLHGINSVSKVISDMVNQQPKPTPKIVALDVDALLSTEFPPMETMLTPWLCKQHLSMVHAWRGVGKTHFSLGVAYAVAGGGEFLKWKAEKPSRVVYIDGEMAGAAIKSRVSEIVHSTPDEHEPPEGFLQIITPDIQNTPLPSFALVEGQALLAPCIADADLIVVDNLSCLMRGGQENDGQSWEPVAEWALNLRRLGKSVLFVHHDGKGGQQRGTSRKEDIMDVVIQLEHIKDHQAEDGAAFLVKFEKARHLVGEETKTIEAALRKDDQNKQIWTYKDAELGMSERILTLHEEVPEMSQTDIANELGCNRSTVSRAFKKTNLIDGIRGRTNGQA
jgi:putative DNA primase/helicase